MGESSGKVPVAAVVSLVCLLASAGITVIVLLSLGYKQGETIYDIMKEAKAKQGTSSAVPAGKGPQDFGSQDPSKGAMSKGLSDPRPVDQLVTLIAKLDTLTAEPGALQLTDEERAKTLVKLPPIREPDYLGDALARQHLEALLKVLQDHKSELEKAGIRWPSAMYNPNTKPPKNPFKEGEAAKHLKSLEEHLAKANQ
jgi:hypothetical protein